MILNRFNQRSVQMTEAHAMVLLQASDFLGEDVPSVVLAEMEAQLDVAREVLMHSGPSVLREKTVELPRFVGSSPMRESAAVRDAIFRALMDGSRINVEFGYDVPYFPFMALDEPQMVELNPVLLVRSAGQLYVLHASPGCKSFLIGLHRMSNVDVLPHKVIPVDRQAIEAYLAGFDLQRHRNPEVQMNADYVQGLFGMVRDG